MSGAVRILFVEDLPTDARLAEREIRKALASCEFHCVDTKEGLLSELSDFQPDIVITDYRMPRFDGLTALRLTLELSPLTPVIVLTSAINEDTAVECMKSGAVDYVIKEHIKRLGQAVVRALEEKQVRRERMDAERDLRIKNSAVESSISAIALADLDGRVFFTNSAFRRMWRCPDKEELTGKLISEFILPGSIAERVLSSLGTGEGYSGEHQALCCDGSTFDALLSAGLVLDEAAKPLCVMLSILDITERRKAEEALRQSEEKYRRFFEDSLSGVYLSTPQGKILACNNAFARIMGYDDPMEVLNVDASRMYATQDRREAFLRRLCEERTLFNSERELVRRDGSSVQVVENVVGEFDEKNSLVQFLGTVFDVTERRRAEVALRDSERRFRDIFRFAPVGICQATKDGTLIMTNMKLAEVLGYDSEEELMRRNLARDIYWDPGEGTSLLASLESLRPEFGQEIRWKRKDGAQIWVNLSMHTIKDASGKPLCFEGFVQDDTDRKRIELALRASLEEKETLLKEIHHRVKNNLQIVSSLLSLQAKEIPDPALQRAFGESQNRIRSMAMIHEQLYRSSSLANINFEAYVKEITMKLAQFYANDKVEFVVEVSNVSLNLERAIPCGLIVNELVTNALKHAFIGREKGRISVLMHCERDGTVQCCVQDDGVGLPPGRRFEEMSSMGSALVCGLVDQLQGTIEVAQQGGTRFVIRFPLHPK